jgi:hypothetical protein
MIRSRPKLPVVYRVLNILRNPPLSLQQNHLRFKLSFRDLVEMMEERGIELAHTTLMRWVQRYTPEFEKRWNRFACKAGRS